MAFAGAVIAIDAGSCSGVADGSVGSAPTLEAVRLRLPDDDYEETWGRAVRFMADRLHAPRAIGDRLYGPGEAAAEGMLRVIIEAPIMTSAVSKSNADSLLITKGLWACLSGFAHARGVMVRRVPVNTVRAQFLGRGNLEGDFAKREARRICRELGWNPPNLDAADAGGLWWYGVNLWAPGMAPALEPLLMRKEAAE